MLSNTFRYDIEGLAKDMEVDLAAISNLYSEYFFEMKSNLEESKELLSDKTWDKLQRVIHNIKGISTSLNVNDIYLIAYKLDNQLKTGNYDSAEHDINYIKELFITAEKDIIDFFKVKDIHI